MLGSYCLSPTLQYKILGLQELLPGICVHIGYLILIFDVRTYNNIWTGEAGGGGYVRNIIVRDVM